MPPRKTDTPNTKKCPHAQQPVNRSGSGATPRPPGSKYSAPAAISVVVANMIGTGVFRSLGFQLVDIQSHAVVLLLWVVGGVAAFSGAISYAELGAAFPRSGGEYVFLGQIYHPAAGFVSGWVSATIGFAAPTALAAMTFGAYLSSVFPSLSATWLGAGLVIVTGAAHMTTYRRSSLFQQAFTTAKIVLVAGFCVAAATLVDQPQSMRLLPEPGDGALIQSGTFAVSLIYVSYAYTGWNAATYLTGELANPTRTLPRVLGGGTLLVTALYLALNYAFLRAAPTDELAGKIEVGYVAATYILGPVGAKVMGVVLAALLVSTVSAMVLAGPRVLQSIGEDYPVFRRLGVRNRDGIPTTAILTQAGITLAILLTASFESILVFAGFTLGLNSLLAVAGMVVLRWRRPTMHRPYRAWGYPWTSLLYIGLTSWTLIYVARDRGRETLVAAAVIGVGLAFYALARRMGGEQRAGKHRTTPGIRPPK